MNFTFKTGGNYYKGRPKRYAECNLGCETRFHVNCAGEIRLNGRTITECPYCKESDMNKVCIEVTKESSGMIQEYLFSKGYSWPCGIGVRMTERKYLVLNLDTKHIMWNDVPDGSECNMNALCDIVSEPKIKIGEYEVKFVEGRGSNGSYIQVGCQEVGFKSIMKILKMLKKHGHTFNV